MENFIVSARKYRPQNFATVVGQGHITTTLKNAIRNHQLAHAFLFCGPRGVGKTTCARILAKTINCEQPTAEGEACNTCNSCKSFDTGSSFNVHELDAASNNTVDDMRNLVEQVRFAPQAGKYKVYIVDEVHMLSSAAFNAFLKTLEEPPSYAIFILATTEKHKILPTILSRCQIFDFKRITNNDTVEHLQEICEKESIQAERTALHLIAQKSEGCMRDSLSILDKIVSFTDGEVSYKNTLEHLNILDEDYFFRLYELLQKQDAAEALLMYDEINRKGFEGDTVLNGFAEFLRNVLVSSDTKAVTLLEVADDFKEKYRQVAGSASLAFLVAALNLLNEAEMQFKQSRNKRLHVELTLIKLAYLNQALELTGNEEGVKKKFLTEQRTIQFRAISGPKRASDSVKAATSVSVTPVSAVQPTQSSAKLIIEPERKATSPAPSSNPVPPVSTETGRRSLGSLNKIRQEIRQKHQEADQTKPLESESLQQAWSQFIQRLREAGNNTAASNFQSASLNIIDPNRFEIIAHSEINKSFIESERANLIQHMQQWFSNRMLVYQIRVEETEEAPVQQEVTVSRRQQYQALTEEYPLIKELRDRLKLDLE